MLSVTVPGKPYFRMSWGKPSLPAVVAHPPLDGRRVADAAAVVRHEPRMGEALRRGDLTQQAPDHAAARAQQDVPLLGVGDEGEAEVHVVGGLAGEAGARLHLARHARLAQRLGRDPGARQQQPQGQRKSQQNAHHSTSHPSCVRRIRPCCSSRYRSSWVTFERLGTSPRLRISITNAFMAASVTCRFRAGLSRTSK